LADDQELAEALQSDPIIITSDQQFAAAAKNEDLFFIVPRKLKEVVPEGLQEDKVFAELSDICSDKLKVLFPAFESFTETKKYVNFHDNQVAKTLPEFRLWKRSADLKNKQLSCLEGPIV